MSEIEKPLSLPLPTDAKTKRRRVPLLVIVSVLAIMIVAAAFVAHLPITGSTSVAPTTTAAVVQMEQRIASLERQAQGFETKLQDLDTRVDRPAPQAAANDTPASASVPADASVANSAQAARMQTDITALSAALATLQSEVKQTGSAEAEARQAEVDTVSAAIAFTQLRDTAASGRGFAEDLATLRGVAPGRAYQEPLAQLAPFAAHGAPSIDTLHGAFLRLENSASVATDKATAVGWKERLAADFKGLISVRPVHGDTPPDVFTTTEDALNAGDLATALATLKHLPAEAQDILKEWRAEAEARLAIDTAMRHLAALFIQPPKPTAEITLQPPAAPQAAAPASAPVAAPAPKPPAHPTAPDSEQDDN